MIYELPTIYRVSDEFGLLKIYASGGNQHSNTCIEFAREMSRYTCEECGKPGKEDGDDDCVKIRCVEHKIGDTVGIFNLHYI